MYTSTRWLEQQPQHFTAEIFPAENATEKCCNCMKKCKLHRIYRPNHNHLDCDTFFHKRKHKTPLLDKDAEEEEEEDEEQPMVELLDQKAHSDFTANILFCVSGYIVSKLVKLLTCPDCITSLTSQPSTNPDQDCCGVRYNSAAAASAFTLFVNNGGLKIPSKSVFQIIEYAELVFKRNVCKEGKSISKKKNLKKTMIMSVCHQFVDIHQVLFAEHEEDINERVLEDEHRIKLVKHCADQYLTLRLFTYAKRFNAN
ncbi:Hypothetical predicted protein [Paramuricea clavata]|uniref:DNA transposase THAP9 C-terminal domain-containing protein n=1 Tax=Paramuricea clavata TaxID=317549 RepID=A0A7D9J1S1_PARCT|nr:Hypothetical predicted protein [Paramuricea clavata]CAB4044751.1 Hypothetical predicted protein [Paramuricea clavata]